MTWLNTRGQTVLVPQAIGISIHDRPTDHIEGATRFGPIVHNGFELAPGNAIKTPKLWDHVRIEVGIDHGSDGRGLII